MTPETLALSVLILAAGAALQAAVGFGMGMMAVPLLLWAGNSLAESVALVLGAATVQMLVGIWGYREHIDARQSLPIALASYVGIPLGVLAMGWLAGLGKDTVQQAAGLAILAALVFRSAVQPKPREQVPLPWGLAAGWGSGFLAGLIGMGGPPIVFFALSHDWDKEKFRTFLWSQFLLANPLILALLSWRFGSSVPVAFVVGVGAFPLVLVGTRLGLAGSSSWDTATVQRAAVGLLGLLGTISLVRPLLQ